MADRFEAVVDNHGRLEHYLRNGVLDAPIRPESIGEYLLGGEMVVLEDAEYNLGETGNLVHPSVEVTDAVTLGSGVRLDEGTTFSPRIKGDETQRGAIEVGDRTRINGTEIFGWVTIDEHALILARFVASGVTIGAHSRLGRGVEVLSETRIGARVRIREDSWIANEVVIEDDVWLTENARVCEGAQIGKGARIGAPSATGLRVDQGGPFIGAGKIIEPGAIVKN